MGCALHQPRRAKLAHTRVEKKNENLIERRTAGAKCASDDTDPVRVALVERGHRRRHGTARVLQRTARERRAAATGATAAVTAAEIAGTSRPSRA